MKRLTAMLLALWMLTACTVQPASEPESSTAQAVSETETCAESEPPAEPLSITERILISEPELICADRDMTFSFDSVIATLRQEDGSILYWLTNNGQTPRYPMYRGTEDNILQERTGLFEWDYNGIRTDDPSSTVWLMNIYKHTDGTLIGFVHREDLYDNNDEEKANFYIGLAISTDGGNHWKYGGDIIGSYMNHKLGRDEPQPNMGGVPYLVVGDYFYLYYNEYISATGRYIGMARCQVDETVEALKNGTLPKVEKLGRNGFDIDPMEGIGKMVVPHSNTGYHDVHADAAWCEPLGRYLLTVQTHQMGQLQMYISEDGIRWDAYVLLDDIGFGDHMQPYSTFVGFEDASDDFHVVGSRFYIYFPRKGIGSNYGYDDLYRVEVQILDEFGNPM